MGGGEFNDAYLSGVSRRVGGQEIKLPSLNTFYFSISLRESIHRLARLRCDVDNRMETDSIRNMTRYTVLSEGRLPGGAEEGIEVGDELS